MYHNFLFLLLKSSFGDNLRSLLKALLIAGSLIVIHSLLKSGRGESDTVSHSSA